MGYGIPIDIVIGRLIRPNRVNRGPLTQSCRVGSGPNVSLGTTATGCLVPLRAHPSKLRVCASARLLELLTIGLVGVGLCERTTTHGRYDRSEGVGVVFKDSRSIAFRLEFSGEAEVVGDSHLMIVSAR